MNKDDDVDLITILSSLFLIVVITIPLADYVFHWWAKYLGWEL